MRLSEPFQTSRHHPLEDGTVFKVGTTIAYQCELQGGQSEQRMEVEYSENCMECGVEKRNVLTVPCRHNVLCHRCGAGLSHCPLCGSAVTEQIKIFV